MKEPFFSLFPDDPDEIDVERLDREQNPIPIDVDELLDIPDEDEVEQAYQRNMALAPGYNQQCWEECLRRDEEQETTYAAEQHFWNRTVVAVTQAPTPIPAERVITPPVPEKAPDRTVNPAIKAEIIKESTSIAPYR